MVRGLVFAACVLGCGARPTPPLKHTAGDDVTLYRDWAVIRQRFELDLPATPTTVKLTIAAGVHADQIMVIDRGGVAITGLHAPTNADAAVDEIEEPSPEDDDDGDGDDPDAEVAPHPDELLAPALEPLSPQLKPAKPTELRLDVKAPRPGRYAIVLAYLTTRLRWDVAYTMTANPARDRAVLRGALAIRSSTGITIKSATTRVIDAELGAWRGKTAERLAAALVGGTQSSTLPATPRELGRVEIAEGETRVELVGASPRRMRAVLVYDPIGTKLDNPGASPLRDPDLGTQPKAAPRVTESFEVARDEKASSGLPAGPVRLLEARVDGSLGVLGESRLFDAATRVAEVDTIAVGTAEGVTGTRERRELTIDDDNKRVVEEFVISIDNQRAHPASVLVREHLYRGQNWTLAYHSAPSAAKEGPQQISLRSEVRAKAQTKLLYVVVYTWGQ